MRLLSHNGGKMKNFRYIFTVLVMACAFSIQGMEITTAYKVKLFPRDIQTELEKINTYLVYDVIIEHGFFGLIKTTYDMIEKNKPEASEWFLLKTEQALRRKENNRNSAHYGKLFVPAKMRNDIYSWIQEKLKMQIEDDYKKPLKRKRK